MRIGRLLRLAAFGLAVSIFAPSAHADELKRLYAQILRDPTNSELNIRYAQLAEQRGEIRKALSAYERVLVNDPNHPEVRRALQRIRRQLQPDTTQFFAEIGTAWDSNPQRVSTGESADGVLLGRLSMRDERGIGNGNRWRTIGHLAGDVYFDNGDLTYGYAGFYTGPLVDITPTIAMHAAVGAGTSYFDHKHFYNEATAHLLFESYLEGAYHTVRFRTGYRSYNSAFPSDDGLFADVTARFSFTNVLGGDDVISVSPWYRWSDVGGVGFSVFTPTEQVQPGRYSEFGGRIEYLRRTAEWLTVGGGIWASNRRYENSFDVVALTETRRRDVLYSPFATVIFHGVFGNQTDLRAQYRFEHNDSNVAFRNYEAHIATLMLISRF